MKKIISIISMILMLSIIIFVLSGCQNNTKQKAVNNDVNKSITDEIRVGELINLNIKDMNFAERLCIVLGKGNKQREVHFDIRTKLHLEEY